MNKRLGNLIAALVLAAVANAGLAAGPTPQPQPQPKPSPVRCCSLATVRASYLPRLEAVRTGASAVRWTRPVALLARRQVVGPRIRSRAQPFRMRVYGRRVPFPGGRFFLRTENSVFLVVDGLKSPRPRKSHEHLMSASGPEGSRRAKVRGDKEVVMNKRLGALIAILVLSAAAESAQAARQPPTPQPGPCFNKKVACRPVPAPCSPTSPSCRRAAGRERPHASGAACSRRRASRPPGTVSRRPFFAVG